MNYLLLIYSDPTRAAAMTPEELQAQRAEVMPDWIALFEYLETHAQSVSGVELDDPPTAKTLRYEDGRAVVTDGPYAETKELIGGVFFLECNDLDEAIDMAARVPSAARGSVEIRPLVEQEARA
ncbi:MAG: YciI family protein [Gaiellaceae bacterium]